MAGAKDFQIDMRGWRKKQEAILKVVAPAIKESVDWGLDKLMVETIKNVSGEHIKPEIKKPRKKKKLGDSKKKSKSSKSTPKSSQEPEKEEEETKEDLKYPVPIITGTLKKSIKPIRYNDWLAAVTSDESIANYNKWVHDGTKYMKPRRFLKDAVTKWQNLIHLKFKWTVIKAIKDAGIKDYS